LNLKRRRYAHSERLRNVCNLVIVGGVIDACHTGDREEAAECEKMHRLIKEHNLRVGRVCVCVCVCAHACVCACVCVCVCGCVLGGAHTGV
jgi:hypothetical protein